MHSLTTVVRWMPPGSQRAQVARQQMTCTIAAMLLRASMLFVLTSVAWAPGCSRKDSQPSPPDAHIAVPAPEFQPGDPVVVETARATFLEGTVRKPGKSRLTVDAQGDAPREVDAANVYLIKNQPAEVPDGTLAICRSAERKWIGCKVERREGSRASIVDEDGERREIELSSILKPTAMTELNLRQSFEQALKRKAFLDGAREAGRPVVPKGWSAGPGDRVLVQTSDGYRGGKVQRVVKKKGQVIVLVDGEGKDARAFSRQELFPQAPQPFTPTAASYACLRPPTGEPIWPVVRIEGANERKVTVSDASGRKWVVESSELTPLVK